MDRNKPPCPPAPNNATFVPIGTRVRVNGHPGVITAVHLWIWSRSQIAWVLLRSPRYSVRIDKSRTIKYINPAKTRQVWINEDREEYRLFSDEFEVLPD